MHDDTRILVVDSTSDGAERTATLLDRVLPGAAVSTASSAEDVRAILADEAFAIGVVTLPLSWAKPRDVFTLLTGKQPGLQVVFSADEARARAAVELVRPRLDYCIVRVAGDEQVSAWLLVQATRRTLDRCLQGQSDADAQNGARANSGDGNGNGNGRRASEPPGDEESLHDEHVYALGQLAGTIAHDFNNLLTIIHGYCHLARKTLRENGDLRTVGFYLDKIADKTTRGGELVDRIMRYSHKQAGQLVEVPINDFLIEMNDMLREVVGEGVELRVDLGPAAGAVQIDPKSLEQVLMNLVDNACDAMHGQGRLVIETSRVDFDEARARARNMAPGRYVALTISDTGCGMPADTLAHIFDPYFTTKELGVGTGLGLASVYSNVRKHGGHIHVDSEVGRGTTFEIYLPEAPGLHPDSHSPHV